jgi:hypothetical protein
VNRQIWGQSQQPWGQSQTQQSWGEEETSRVKNWGQPSQQQAWGESTLLTPPHPPFLQSTLLTPPQPPQKKKQKKLERQKEREREREEKEDDIEEMEKRGAKLKYELQQESEKEREITQAQVDRILGFINPVTSSLKISDAPPQVRTEEIITESDASKRQRNAGMLSTLDSNYAPIGLGRKRFAGVGESFVIDDEETETEEEDVYEATNNPNVFILKPRDIKKGSATTIVGGTKAQTRVSKKQLQQTPISVVNIQEVTPSTTIHQLDLSQIPFSPSSTPPSST